MHIKLENSQYLSFTSVSDRLNDNTIRKYTHSVITSMVKRESEYNVLVALDEIQPFKRIKKVNTPMIISIGSSLKYREYALKKINNGKTHSI